MPLSINVGLSRKASRDYQSTGVSINVTAELDQALLAQPQELQRRIDDLYTQAEQALDRRVQVRAEPDRAGRREDRGGGRFERDRRDGRHNQTSDPEGNGGNGRGMTCSQRRAIESICRRMNVDPAGEIRHEFGWELGNLGVREASQVIDHLKRLQPAQNNGRGSSGR